MVDKVIAIPRNKITGRAGALPAGALKEVDRRLRRSFTCSSTPTAGGDCTLGRGGRSGARRASASTWSAPPNWRPPARRWWARPAPLLPGRVSRCIRDGKPGAAQAAGHRADCGGIDPVRGGARDGIILNWRVARVRCGRALPSCQNTSSGRVAQLAEQVTLNH